MLIQDPALRSLFKTESDEHLQRLDEVLLRLEQAPAELPLVEEAFREAHSMKGAARMLGLKTILALTTRLEGSLNLARQGKLALNRDSITQMLREIDAIRRHVGEATGAGPAAPAPPPPSAQPPEPPQVAVPPAPTFDPPVSRIESVRIDTRKLDELMTHAGELVVMRTRVSQRLGEIDALADDLEAAVRSLPEAHAAALGLILQSLGHLRGTYAEDGARLETLSHALEGIVQQIRMLPFAHVLKQFPRMVHDLAHEQGKPIELRIEGEDTLADKRILEEIKDPLMHILRNAIDHGIEAPEQRQAAGKPPGGRITIGVSHAAGRVVIVVGDDGRGLDLDRIRATARQRGLASDEALAAMSTEQLQALILLPGFSTKCFVTDVSGRGVGMDVVRVNIERLKGTLDIESTAGHGTRFTIRVPVTLATMRVLLVEVGGFQYGLPTDSVGVSRIVAPAGIFTREGRNVVLYRGAPVPVVRLADLLGIPAAPAPSPAAATEAGTPCVFLTVGKESFGVLVDAMLGEQHMILKPKSPLLNGVRNVLGASILSTGEICTVLAPGDLLASLPGGTATAPVAPVAPRQAQGGERKKLILLAEDSITTRAQEVRILEGAGYEVVAATDGLDAYGKLGSRHFDAVVSDINMPRLDGLQLAEKIRAIPEYANLPIILVTSLSSDEDKRRGLEIGANAYITKPEFDQSILLECLERLVG
jgi:two-component system chemotaxis sensor kinase CheA